MSSESSDWIWVAGEEDREEGGEGELVQNGHFNSS